MGRKKLTIEQTRIKNLPFNETGGFLYALPNESFIVIDKVSIPTGKRGRKPVAFQVDLRNGTLTLDAELTLADALRVIAETDATIEATNE